MANIDGMHIAHIYTAILHTTHTHIPNIICEWNWSKQHVSIISGQSIECFKIETGPLYWLRATMVPCANWLWMNVCTRRDPGHFHSTTCIDRSSFWCAAPRLDGWENAFDAGASIASGAHSASGLVNRLLVDGQWWEFSIGHAQHDKANVEHLHIPWLFIRGFW